MLGPGDLLFHGLGEVPSSGALAGPLGDERKVLIVMRADSAAEIEQLLAQDIWTRMGLLETENVEEWTLRLGSLEGE